MKRLLCPLIALLFVCVLLFSASSAEASSRRCCGGSQLRASLKKIFDFDMRCLGRSRCSTTVATATTTVADIPAPVASPAPQAAPAPKVDAAKPDVKPAKPQDKQANAEEGLLPAVQATETETILVERVNEERTRRGLKPLVFCSNLLTSARKHCLWMASTHRMQHTSAPVGENIAMGQPTITSVMTTWMNSSGHRANILGGWNRVGSAAYVSSSGRIYYALQFLR